MVLVSMVLSAICKISKNKLFYGCCRSPLAITLPARRTNRDHVALIDFNPSPNVCNIPDESSRSKAKPHMSTKTGAVLFSLICFASRPSLVVCALAIGLFLGLTMFGSCRAFPLAKTCCVLGKYCVRFTLRCALGHIPGTCCRLRSSRLDGLTYAIRLSS